MTVRRRLLAKITPNNGARILLAIIVAGIFLPRFFWLDTFFIQDEHLWINRAHLYTTALSQFDLEAASAFELQNHPAITLLTTVGPTMQLYSWWHHLPGMYESWSVNERREAAAWARWAMGLHASLALLAGYALLRKTVFFHNRAAAAGAVIVLIGLEPWVWGITRTVIVDTLMAIFLILSLIIGVIARERKGWRWVFWAGSLWGLAFISKSPALILAPIAFLLPTVLPLKHWREMLRRQLAWLVGAYVAMSIFWPPFFIHPLLRLRGVLARVEYHTALTEAYLWPGTHVPLFLYVLSGFATIGCIIYVFLRIRDWRRWRSKLLLFDVLLISGLFFAAVLLYEHGDHVRKNVPVLALLAGTGAMGWVLLLQRFRLASSPLLAGLVLVQLALIYPWFPHLPSYHNSLYPDNGGKRLLVDVGNGSRLIADYINWHPEVIYAATNLPGLVAPYVRDDRRGNIRRLPETWADRTPDTTHLIVPESFSARVRFDPAAASLLRDLRGKTPETVLSVRDVPLFSVYRVASDDNR